MTLHTIYGKCSESGNVITLEAIREGPAEYGGIGAGLALVRLPEIPDGGEYKVHWRLTSKTRRPGTTSGYSLGQHQNVNIRCSTYDHRS